MSKETKFSKGREGWNGETEYLNVNGYDWKITTSKRSNGIISCNASGGKIKKENGYSTFSFAMFTDPNINLVSEKLRTTEANIKKVHYEGLAAFDKLKDSGELPVNKENTTHVVSRGLRFYLNGYGNDKPNLYVYEVEDGTFGKKIKYVNADTLELGRAERITSENEIFGIGYYYYDPAQYMDEDKLDNLVLEGYAKKKEDDARRESSNTLERAKTQAKIEESINSVSVPSWAKAVIVAEMWENHSDSMTDYFNARPDSDRTVYLEFSKSSRNNMSELRKAALKFEETKKYGPGMGDFTPIVVANEDGYSSGLFKQHYKGVEAKIFQDLYTDDSFNKYNFTSKADAEAFIKSKGEPEDRTGEDGKVYTFSWLLKDAGIEQRSSGSYDPGFYVGSSSWGGWKVSKLRWVDIHTKEFKDTLAIAKTEGRYLIDSKAKSSIAKSVGSGENFEIIETIHTKKGTPIFVAKVLNRVERDEFNELKARAKENGGYYSSYRGSGAIPGFIFSTKEDAETFAGTSGSDENDLALLELEAEAIKIKFKFGK